MRRMMRITRMGAAASFQPVYMICLSIFLYKMQQQVIFVKR